MKISTTNYCKAVDSIGFENLPLVLKQSHTVILTQTDNGNDWSKYKSDKELQQMIQLTFQKLEEFMQSKNMDLKGINKADELHGNYLTPKSVAIKFIEPYVLDGDTMSLHPANKLSIEAEDFAAHIENKEVVVTMLYGTKISASFPIDKLMKEITSDYFKKKYQPEEKKDRKKRSTFHHKQPEFKVLKAILNWHNATVWKRQVESFINELQNYIQTKQITKESLVAEEIELVQKKLLAVFNSMGEKIKIELSLETKKRFQVALKKVTDTNALKTKNDKKDLGIIPTHVVPPVAEKQHIMNSMDFAQMQFNTIGLKEKWLDFIGDPAPGFTAMIYGRPKMGKSYLCVDFAGYLARHHGKVLYVAKEEKLDATLQKKLNDKDVAHPNLFVADNLPNNLTPYQFVILDSVNKLELHPKDLTKLKTDNPTVSFLYIFQTTKDGKFRGANEFQHDVDVVIEVPEQGKAIQYGRFNQGGEMQIFEDQKNTKTIETNTDIKFVDKLHDENRSVMLDGIKRKAMQKGKSNKLESSIWTEPKFLNKKDHADLKQVNELYKKKKFKEALDFASGLDTIVREEIPSSIWHEIGGELTDSGKRNLQAEKSIYPQLQSKIAELTQVINTLSKEKKANWGLVAGLAHIHASLGEALHDEYKEHHGYSSSIKEGITRHVQASKKLLKELAQKLKIIFQKKHFEDLNYWNIFLDEILESQTNTKKKIEQEKNYPKRYKYVSDNPRLIKSGLIVLDEEGCERFIVEASDKSVRLEGDRDWKLISKLKFNK